MVFPLVPGNWDPNQSAPKERRRCCVEKRLCRRCFWRVFFFSAPLRFSGVLRANLKGAEKKRTLQKHSFGQPFLLTTPSPLLWCIPKITFQQYLKQPQKVDLENDLVSLFLLLKVKNKITLQGYVLLALQDAKGLREGPLIGSWTIRMRPSTFSCTVPRGYSPNFGGFPVENLCVLLLA